VIYLIGGPARAGKSTLARMVRKEVDAQVISGDALRHSLIEQLTPEWFPELFEHTIDPFNEFETDEMKIMRLRRRDEAMWGFYWRYAEAAAKEEDDVLIDGNLWPDFIHTFPLEHRAVFMVDTSPDQAKRLIAIRDYQEPNDWMREANYSNEKIIKWAKFNLLRSRLVIDLCKKHGYPYFDIKDDGMDSTQARALDYLMGRGIIKE
jgi:2-phosphoglycerate kinase